MRIVFARAAMIQARMSGRVRSMRAARLPTSWARAVAPSVPTTAPIPYI